MFQPTTNAIGGVDSVCCLESDMPHRMRSDTINNSRESGEFACHWRAQYLWEREKEALNNIEWYLRQYVAHQHIIVAPES